MARKPLSKRTRFEVFKRDLFTCQYCGRRPPDVMLQADHIVPVAEGGADELANLTTACQACNAGKSDKSLGDVAPALNEQDRLEAMQEMLERRNTLKAEIAIARAKDQNEEMAVAMVREWWDTLVGLEDVFEDASIRMFLKWLTLAELRDCVEAAVILLARKPHSSPTACWKYFCGAAWKMRRQNEAQ